MKKIMNSILTSIYAVTAVIGPVPVLRLIMWFVNVIVAMWQLYFLRKKIVLRSYFIKDNIIEVHNSRYLLTATEICKLTHIKDWPLLELCMSHHGQCMVIGDHKGGIIVQMEESYDDNSAVFWHEIGHVFNRDTGKERVFEQEMQADLVAASMVGKEAMIAQLRKLKTTVDHSSWWLKLAANDGEIEYSSVELACRIKDVENWSQELLDELHYDVRRGVRFVDDNQEVA